MIGPVTANCSSQHFLPDNDSLNIESSNYEYNQ